MKVTFSIYRHSKCVPRHKPVWTFACCDKVPDINAVWKNYSPWLTVSKFSICCWLASLLWAWGEADHHCDTWESKVEHLAVDRIWSQFKAPQTSFAFRRHASSDFLPSSGATLPGGSFLQHMSIWGTFPTQTITFPYPLKHIRRLSGQFCRVSERMKVKNHEKALMEVATVNKVYAVIKTILNSHYLSASAGLRGEHKELSFENTCLFRLQSNQGQGQDTGFSLKTKYDSKISAYWMVENRQVLRARTRSWEINPSSLHLQIHSPRVGGPCAWKASTPEALSDSCCCHLLASSTGKWQGSENTNPLVCRRHSHFPWKLLEKRKTKAHSTRQKPD